MEGGGRCGMNQTDIRKNDGPEIETTISRTFCSLNSFERVVFFGHLTYLP